MATNTISVQEQKIIDWQNAIAAAKEAGLPGVEVTDQIVSFEFTGHGCSRSMECLTENNPYKTYITDCSYSGLLEVRTFSGGRQIENCSCHHVSELKNISGKGVAMTLVTVTERQKKSLSPTDVAFIEANVLDNSMSLTNEGKNQLVEFLFETNKAAFGKAVTAMVAAEKKAREDKKTE